MVNNRRYLLSVWYPSVLWHFLLHFYIFWVIFTLNHISKVFPFVLKRKITTGTFLLLEVLGLDISVSCLRPNWEMAQTLFLYAQTMKKINGSSQIFEYYSKQCELTDYLHQCSILFALNAHFTTFFLQNFRNFQIFWENWMSARFWIWMNQ